MKSSENKEKSSHLPNFPKLEEEVLVRWKKLDIFEKTLQKTKKGKRFVFYDGPPTANGQPHIGHVETRAFKDIIPRFKTMQGYFVERKAGWDTQGLPVELEVEKALGISGKKDIEKYGVEKFNAEAKKSVWKYKVVWEKMSERVGFWLDFDHPYITYSNEYIESLWWIFSKIWEQKLLEQDFKVVPYCPRCETALSSHEVAQGYQSVKEPSVYVKFELVDEPGTFVLAWTTTPWTLPGNVALAVGEKIMYAKTAPNAKGERYIVAVDRMGVLKGEDILAGVSENGNTPIPQETFPGSKLVGKKYKPLFDFLNLEKESGKKAYYIAPADFVSTEDGTGVVHTAVMYGEDDFLLGKKLDLPTIHTVDLTGRFNELVKPWKGLEVKDAKGETQKKVTEYLREKGLLYKIEEYEHDYPFCWRCKHPLLYYAKNSWFIRMSKLREQLIANNETINWFPDHIKEGRFGEWLREVKDWAISRERYWGTPLPIWECSECKHQECLGSFADLEKKLGKKLPKDFDPHRPFVDALTYSCSNCKKGSMQRVSEVADAWFDSGSMPFAQWHYPFENEERIVNSESYPADYISEAIDQTRGWFYTLLAVATLLQKAKVVKEPPFKNVIVLGHLNDAKGRKLSKSLGNYIDPMEIIDEVGADAVRFYMYTANAPWEPKNFDTKLVADIVRKNFLILWNVITFWELASSGSGNKSPNSERENVMDCWIVALRNQLVTDVTKNLESYDVTNAARKLSDFINDLSTWYVRRSRAQLKNSGVSRKVLQETLLVLCELMAPFTPFLADAVYTRIGGKKASVHLEDWPTTTSYDEKVLNFMKTTRQIVELGHALREQAKVKVRQPLGQLAVKGVVVLPEFFAILQDELNVKEVVPTTTLPTHKEWISSDPNEALAAALDITITDELLYEGWGREIIRALNDLRKKAKLTPSDTTSVLYDTEDTVLVWLMEQYKDTIMHEARATSLNKKKNTGTPLQLGERTITLQLE